MKIDRLIGILSILLQEEKITEQELADRFEVSRRTIIRDMEDLSKAGIPLTSSQGIGGGVSIMSGYRMDRTLLTSKDMRMILAGLRSLDSVGGSSYYGQLMEKIQSGSSELISGRDSILIDLASWYKDTLAPKIETIQDAIENRHLITFNYYAPSGDSIRTIEPYYIVFKWTSWYVWGWCLKRKDFRMFKLNRMDKLKETSKEFECRTIPAPDFSSTGVFPERIKVKALFAPDVKWRLIEEYGPDCYKEEEDGRLLLEIEHTDEDNLIGWIMTFGDRAELIEPVSVRKKISELLNKMTSMYGKG
jgi:predicted DNA-binding transcriptional regulator YafY